MYTFSKQFVKLAMVMLFGVTCYGEFLHGHYLWAATSGFLCIIASLTALVNTQHP